MSKSIVPRFRLQKVYDDGSSSEPIIHSLSEVSGSCKMSRRGFLTTSSLSIAAIVSACGGSNGDGGVVQRGTYANGNPFPQVKGIFGHLGVYEIATNGISNRIVTINYGTVKLWELPSLKLIATIEMPGTTSVTSLATDTNNNIFSYSFGTTVFIHSMLDGSLIDSFEAGGFIYDMEFNASGTALVILDWRDNPASPGPSLIPKLNSIDIETKEATPLPVSYAYDYKFNVDKTIYATPTDATRYITTARFWQYPSGNEITYFLGENTPDMPVCFSPDGLFIASPVYGTSNEEKSVRIWNTINGNFAEIFTGANFTFEFHPDGDLLISVSGHGVYSDGIVTGSEPGKLLVVDTPAGTIKRTITNVPGTKMHISADGNYIIFFENGGRYNILVFETNNYSLISSLADSTETTEGTFYNYYTVADIDGNIQYLASIDDIPAGAACLCVPVEGKKPITQIGGGPGGSGGGCSCNSVCSCVPVFI